MQKFPSGHRQDAKEHQEGERLAKTEQGHPIKTKPWNPVWFLNCGDGPRSTAKCVTP